MGLLEDFVGAATLPQSSRQRSMASGRFKRSLRGRWTVAGGEEVVAFGLGRCSPWLAQRDFIFCSEGIRVTWTKTVHVSKIVRCSLFSTANHRGSGRKSGDPADDAQPPPLR